MQDRILQQDIIDELDFEPSIEAAGIGVAVEDGIVTLSGHVPTYSQKTRVLEVVNRLRGVRGIAEEIEVRPSGANLMADDEIARRAANALVWNEVVPDKTIRVTVHRGRIALSGTVNWQYEKTAAGDAVRGIAGVTGLNNLIEVRPVASAEDVKKRIEDALRRSAEFDAGAISVFVSEGKVILEGHVKAYRERQAAERAAWSAPGVRQVEDHLQVR